MSSRARLGALLGLAMAWFPFARAAGAPPYASADSLDAAAARRRAEILRAPYARVAERRVLRGGEVVVSFDAGVPPDFRETLSVDLAAFVAALVDRDEWQRPFSARSPLQILFSAGPGVTAAGWDGRDAGGSLRSPVVMVPLATRPRRAALFDAANQVAALSLRQSGPALAPWAVEGVAAWLARRDLGFGGPDFAALRRESADPFLEESGALTAPGTLAAFLDVLERRLPRGSLDVREAWEQAGENDGDDPEPFLRNLAARTGAPSLGARLAETVAARVVADAGRRGDAASSLGRRAWLVGDLPALPPAPLGWRRVPLRTDEERAGLEVALPDSGAKAARLLLFYRGDGGFDSIAAAPGAAHMVPAAGTTSVQIVLADGDGGPEAALRVRRVPDYPAALASSRAGWANGGVEIAWETSRHRNLLGWVIERRDELDGESQSPSALAFDLLPAAREAADPTGYFWLDRDAVPGRRYRYRVLALTEDGLLGEAFETSVAGR
jgi:hypothetical protein